MNIMQYRRNPDMIDGALDGNQVMMHLNAEMYYGLNPIAKRIWEIIDQPRELDQIVLTLMDEYDVDYDQCVREVTVFLEKAVKNEIVLQN